ncbi:MAG: hypothetical protein AAF943_18650 [Pseudomonadota bacterium]
MTPPAKSACSTSALTAALLSLAAAPALSDTITGDLSVRNRICVGETCMDIGDQSFDREALLINANNAWIRFEDSSNPNGTFPTNDWQLKVNDSTSGGQNYMAIEDLDGGTVPFRVDAGARDNALRVTPNGSIGMGTGFPIRKMHLVDDIYPVLRMETSSASSFGAYTWDIGANSIGYFIENITSGGNNLPFQILAGTGNDNALIIDRDGEIGLGTLNPQARLHVAGTSMLIQNAGRVNFTLSDTSDPGPDFRTQLTAGTARFSFVGTGAPEMELFQSGDLSIRGRYISAGTQLTVPDYVFADDYALRPLAEVQSFIDTHSHLPDVPSAADIAEDGLDMTEMQMTLLKKIEELTLYTLDQEATITAQRAQNAAQAAKVAALEQMLSTLSADVTALKAAQN